MRKVVEHIDERNWRTLEYFRMLDKQNKLQLNHKTVTLDIVVSKIFRLISICKILVRKRVCNWIPKIFRQFIVVSLNDPFDH